MKKEAPVIVANLEGGFSVDTILAEDFVNDDVNGKTKHQNIPRAYCYVKEDVQDKLDTNLNHKDYRKCSIRVWKQKEKNLRLHGKFMTNYDLDAYKNKATNSFVAFMKD